MIYACVCVDVRVCFTFKQNNYESLFGHRSGEEGHFPDLEKFAAKRLETLNPKSRLLRVEMPILRSEHLNKDELTELKRSFLVKFRRKIHKLIGKGKVIILLS